MIYVRTLIFFCIPVCVAVNLYQTCFVFITAISGILLTLVVLPLSYSHHYILPWKEEMVLFLCPSFLIPEKVLWHQLRSFSNIIQPLAHIEFFTCTHPSLTMISQFPCRSNINERFLLKNSESLWNHHLNKVTLV